MKCIVCFGDSITAASGSPEGKCWTALFQAQLETELGGEWHVYNRGVGGNTTWQALDRFEPEIRPLLPAYVLIEFGFNDASVPLPRKIARCPLPVFQQNLVEIIRLVRARKGNPILLTNQPIGKMKEIQGNKRTYAANYTPYQGAIRKMAATTKTPLIDLEKEIKKAGVKLNDLVGDDGLHLTSSGEKIYARFVFAGFKAIYDCHA